MDFISIKLDVHIFELMKPKVLAFGVNINVQHNKPINCLMTIAKFVIYRNRVNNVVPTFRDFYNLLCDVERSERYCATKSDKLRYHNVKWKCLLVH